MKQHSTQRPTDYIPNPATSSKKAKNKPSVQRWRGVTFDLRNDPRPGGAEPTCKEAICDGEDGKQGNGCL